MPGGAFGRRAGAGDSLSFVAGFPTLPRRAVLRVAPWVTFRFGRSAWGRSALSLEELFGLTVAPFGAKKGKPVRPIFSRANGLFGDVRRWPHRREPIAYVLISCVLPAAQACFVQACLAPSGPVRPPRPVEMS